MNSDLKWFLSLSWGVLRTGARTLMLHKLRSALSVSGILLGVSAVIAMYSIGEGARRKAVEQVEALGTNNIIIRARELTDYQRAEAERNSILGLNIDDADTIRKYCDHVSYVAPILETEKDIAYEGRTSTGSIVGTVGDFFPINNLRLREGRILTSVDDKSHARVCVLGADVARQLFFGKSGLGESIKVGQDWFTVVGILEDKQLPRSGEDIVGTEGERIPIRDVNSDLYMPISTARNLLTEPSLLFTVDEIAVQVSDSSLILDAKAQIQDKLRTAHNPGKIAEGWVPTYTILIPQEIIRFKDETQRLFQRVTGGIAMIALIVGGIGIMNIMLATVSERTKEVGIRRALGARRVDILQQFLVESLILTVAGGLAGIVTGSIVSKLITFYVKWPTEVSLEAVFFAILVSTATGLIFGIYPARRAAELDPVEAIRMQ